MKTSLRFWETKLLINIDSSHSLWLFFIIYLFNILLTICFLLESNRYSVFNYSKKKVFWGTHPGFNSSNSKWLTLTKNTVILPFVTFNAHQVHLSVLQVSWIVIFTGHLCLHIREFCSLLTYLHTMQCLEKRNTQGRYRMETAVASTATIFQIIV